MERSKLSLLNEQWEIANEAAEGHRTSVGTSDLVWEVLLARVCLLEAEIALAVSQEEAAIEQAIRLGAIKRK